MNHVKESLAKIMNYREFGFNDYRRKKVAKKKGSKAHPRLTLTPAKAAWTLTVEPPLKRLTTSVGAKDNSLQVLTAAGDRCSKRPKHDPKGQVSSPAANPNTFKSSQERTGIAVKIQHRLTKFLWENRGAKKTAV